MLASTSVPKSEDDLRADLAALPDHLEGELVDGELLAQPRPRFRHGRASGFRTHPIGGCVRLSPFEAIGVPLARRWVK